MGEKKPDGGEAFPRGGFASLDHGYIDQGANGMSLRDWFAGQALAALISKSPFFDKQGRDGPVMKDMRQFKKDMAESAYWYADAMLAAKETELE